jgi:iron complex outermembrane receptor protein
MQMPDQQLIYPGLSLRKLKTIIALPCSLLLRGLVVSHSAQGAEPAPNQPTSQQANYQIRSQSLDRALVEFFGVRFFS